ncbi:MAG TPA: hypothetical protein PKC97_09480 [Burkholderiaceae bacterium]|nr:hypothetical protein [Burkholderiaceae bacterium]
MATDIHAGSEGAKSGRNDADDVRSGRALLPTTVWLALIGAAVAVAALVTFHISGAGSLKFSHNGEEVSVELQRGPLTAEKLQGLLEGDGKNAQAAQVLKAILAQAGYVSVNEKPRADAIEKLKQHGLYPVEETGLADALATRFETLYAHGKDLDLVDQYRARKVALAKIPSLVELRRQAEVQERPFQPIAIEAYGSLPGMSARPASNCIVKISRPSLQGKAIRLVNPKDVNLTLTVRAQSGPPDMVELPLINLSADQFNALRLEATESVKGLQGKVASLLLLPVPASEAPDGLADCDDKKSAKPSAGQRASGSQARS